MENLTELQEQVDTIFNSIRIYKQLIATSYKQDMRMMYERRLAAEESRARKLELKINLLISEELAENA